METQVADKPRSVCWKRPSRYVQCCIDESSKTKEIDRIYENLDSILNNTGVTDFHYIRLVVRL
jgi:hypothetical protein